MKLDEIIINTIKAVIREKIENMTPFEEYQQNYPNDDFDVSGMSQYDLGDWCENNGDFLYIYDGLKGLSIMSANTDDVIDDIVSDLYNCNGIEATHEVDYLFGGRKERYFDNYYICIFKLKGTKDGDYYVVYTQDKWQQVRL